VDKIESLHMKKVLLSSIVIISYVAYVLRQQNFNQNSNNALAGNSSPLQQTNNQSVITENQKSGNYNNGVFTGDSTDAYYGNVQVKVTISNGKITDVTFLDYPQDRGHSIRINDYAMPSLKSEAIQAQSAQVDIVSGATQTSKAFIQSLSTALVRAQK
jgi:uncharacterized protein with FMN-binding domain